MLSRASPDASGRTARRSPLIMADHPMNNLSALEKRVIDSITEDAWLDLTRELVVAGQPDSENPLDPDMPSGHEEAIALLVAGKLEAMGLGVELRAQQPGRPGLSRRRSRLARGLRAHRGAERLDQSGERLGHWYRGRPRRQLRHRTQHSRHQVASVATRHRHQRNLADGEAHDGD